MVDLFLSYRRRDSGGHASLLYKAMCERFGKKRVFMDTKAIPGGAKWSDEIEAALRECRVMLAIIGPDWSSSRLADPDDWVRAVFDCLDTLKAENPGPLSAVGGIGLSGQMHGATLLDAGDKPLRPCILWNDGRSATECEEFEQACPQSRELSGNIAMPGFTAPKILWVRKHEPAVFEALRAAGHSVRESDDIGASITHVDIAYSTRIQEERFSSREEANMYRGRFRLNQSIYTKYCEPNTVIMHPLPRDSRADARELDDDLNENPKLAIFRQTDNGVLVRMALFAMVLDVVERVTEYESEVHWYTGKRFENE